MSVNEKQTFVMALNGGMIGKHYPTKIDESVLEPMKQSLKKDLNVIFSKTSPVLLQTVFPTSVVSRLVEAGHTNESTGPIDGATQEGGVGKVQEASAGGGAAAVVPGVASQRFCKEWLATGECYRGDTCWNREGHTEECRGREARKDGGAATASLPVAPLSSSKWRRSLEQGK
jgi:hypothetical protein